MYRLDGDVLFVDQSISQPGSQNCFSSSLFMFACEQEVVA